MKKLEFRNILKRNSQAVIVILTITLLGLILNFYNGYKNNELRNLYKSLNNIYLHKTATSFLDNLQPRLVQINHKVNEGESFEKILKSLNLPKNEINEVLNNLSKVKKIIKIYPGQEIIFYIDKKEPIKVNQIDFKISSTKNLIAKRSSENNNFFVKTIEKNLTKKIFFEEAKITSSLYKSAIDVKIPPKLIVEFARIYGFQIDFQRDIWRNDRFQILYEGYLNDEKKQLDSGNILYANLILKGKEYPLYYFSSNNFRDHYDERGQSIKKTLMKTPINGARLSSKFGKRKHPILGFTKMHTGTDFAAPMGTPIMASGDGIVIKSSWCGGGGNCVKIKHNSIYTTVYAHMSKFGRGIKKGTRVKQGQIIGYVGSTGLSTGPHLHYEVIENGRKINSQTLKLPSGKTLKGKERKEFEVVKIKTNVLISEIINQ